MKKLLWVILIIMAIAVIIWRPKHEENITPNYQELIHRIDSLDSQLNLLKLERDSLYNVIDSSVAKVEVIEHWYEKELIDVTHQSIADDVVFFTEYLSEASK